MKLFSFISITIISFLISKFSQIESPIPNNVLIVIFSFLVSKLIFPYFSNISPFINKAGEFGFLTYLFLSGMNLNIENYQTEIQGIIPLSISTFFINFAIFLLIFKLFNFNWKTSVIISLILSETSSNFLHTVYNNNLIEKSISNLNLFNNISIFIIFILIAFFLSFSISDNIFISIALILYVSGNIISKYIPSEQNTNIKNILIQITNIFLPLFFIYISSFINLSNISLITAFGLSFVSIFATNIGAHIINKFYNIDLKVFVEFGRNIIGKSYLQIILAYIAYKNKIIPINLLANIIVMFIINNIALQIYVNYKKHFSNIIKVKM
jgi:Kef-type K+ transport system membrane component KefB